MREIGVTTRMEDRWKKSITLVLTLSKLGLIPFKFLANPASQPSTDYDASAYVLV